MLLGWSRAKGRTWTGGRERDQCSLYTNTVKDAIRRGTGKPNEYGTEQRNSDKEGRNSHIHEGRRKREIIDLKHTKAK